MPAILESGRWDRISNAEAAATTDINSASVDMAADNGYEGVEFMVAFGTITSGAVTSVKVQGSTDDSSFSDLTGTSATVADTDDNKIVVVEIYKPTYRYLRVVVDRGTQNAVVDGIFARLHSNRLEAVSQSSDVISSEIHLSPAAGTA